MIVEIGMISVLGLVISNVWVWRDFVHLRQLVYMIPSKEEIIKEIISTKIPVTMGPNGVPVMATPKSNPLVG